MNRNSESDSLTDGEPVSTDDPNGRRRVLKGLGALGVAGIAGCLGDGDGNTPTDTDTPPGGTDTPPDGTDTPPDGTDTPPGETDTPTPPPPPEVPDDVRILVVSATPDYRHGSIPAGNEALTELGERMQSETGAESVTVDIIDSRGEHATTEPTTFPSDPEALAEYDVLVFNNANGGTPPDEGPDVLDADQAAAFEAFVRSGGGVVGIHSTIDAQRADSFYAEVMGSYFASHPPGEQEGTIAVTDRVHPSTRHLPTEWDLKAEWYTFTEDPRGDAHVLMSTDESSLRDHGDMNAEGHHHPAAWCKEVAGGRSWYTALGHRPEHFENKNVRDHIYGGIMWAAGFAEGDATGTVRNAYEKTQLTDDTRSPSTIDVAPDGRVFYVDRRDYNDGNPEAVMVLDPVTKETTEALELPVSETRLNGIRGMALDANFGDTDWIYLYYGPPASTVEDYHNRLSRFTVEDGSIDTGSEVVVLQVPVLDSRKGHLGGNLAWGPDGEQLYLTTGDDTNPFESSGYTPIDERDGQAYNDAQRTSGNTNDLRGSILRIVPNDNGSYDIPDGNLIDAIDDASTDSVRPEIYATGFRNPYRMSVDPATGVPYVADYGPDAGEWSASRGPPGITQYLRLDEPGFYGWPYFRGPNIPYRDYDFETGESGDLFDPGNPTNDSPRNDGLSELPPPREPMITSPASWDALLEYPDDWETHVPWESAETNPSTGDVPFPEIFGGSPMQGPVYRHREEFGEAALSPYFDGKAFIMERGENWIKYVSVDEAGEPYQVEPFLPEETFLRPMDMAVGPNGALYLAEWGSGYGAPNDDSGIYRITAGGDTSTGSLLVSVSGVDDVESGATTTASVRLDSATDADAESVEVSLESDSDAVTVSDGNNTAPGTVRAGASHTAEWEVSVSDSAAGSYTLTARATFTLEGESRTVTESVSVSVAGQVSAPFGLNCGGETPVTAGGVEFVPTPQPSVEVSGNPDASNNGTAVAASGTGDPISGTDNDELYRSLQYGGDLTYETAIANGTYDVTLYFVENFFGDGEPGNRSFDVSVQGETVLEGFDPLEEGGHDVAVSRTFTDVEVTDGTLRIATTTQTNNSSVSGIAILDPGSSPPE
jgi:glucose/arabinose dehydrogenase